MLDQAEPVGLGALLREKALAAQREDVDLESDQPLQRVVDELGRCIGERPRLFAICFLRLRQRFEV
ncbi:hypothetical protein FQZ97_572090 [compost metagenome]